jgi:hypothetical protein
MKNSIPNSKNIAKQDPKQSIDAETKKALDKFSEELSILIKKHKIVEYAGVFVVKNKPIVSFYPDDVTATKLLKNAHSMCRESVINKIGG